MKGYITNIEQRTQENTAFRDVLYTSRYCQLVVMSIPAGEDIGKETHGLDQFIRVERGQGIAVLDGEEFPIEDGSAIVIPTGTEHNVMNTSNEEALKLYTVYSPPEHQDKTTHATKADVQEEHFDGKTSEDLQKTA